MLNSTVTLFHRTAGEEWDTWTPTVLRGVNTVFFRRRETGERSAAAVSGTVNVRHMLSVPASLWPEEAAPGDYIVPGECGQGAFSGSGAEVLLPIGGRQIRQIGAYLYGSALDHYEVILR